MKRILGIFMALCILAISSVASAYPLHLNGDSNYNAIVPIFAKGKNIPLGISTRRGISSPPPVHDSTAPTYRG